MKWTPHFPVECTEEMRQSDFSLRVVVRSKPRVLICDGVLLQLHGNGLLWREAAYSEVTDKHSAQASLYLHFYYAH